MRHFRPRGSTLPPRFGRSGFFLAAAFKHKTVVFFFFCTLHSYLVLKHSFMYIGRVVPVIIRDASLSPKRWPLPTRFGRYGFIWFILATAFKHRTNFLYLTLIPGPKTILHVHLQRCTWYNGGATMKLMKMHCFHPARCYYFHVSLHWNFEAL